ncbi:PIR protein [Plasmodium ovale]|uniref:PIR Superfamily Protein n=2 Tax=Plasmodium ovale TaxID=36330 RepID=A0A1A8XEH6_PLAOA|nr:PIR Superfamily Protein [Plasmodium ovale curtisi]SBT83284.1 PIR protein [Plasmodium ovale]
MPCEKGAGKYKFCLSSNYYEELLKYAKDHKSEVDKNQQCDNLSTSMTFSEDIDAKNICQEFKALYKSFSDYPLGKSSKNDISPVDGSSKNETSPVSGSSENDPLSNYDCYFLNYWLNGKLRESVKYGSINVKEFYEKIKKQDDNSFSKTNDLEEHLDVINPNVLENMKLLYELYENAVKIINIINDPTYKPEENKSCSDYIKECDDKYKEAMDNCLSSNADYYNALKLFKYSYQFLTASSTNKSDTCVYSEFCHFPEYDPVLERKQRNIMAGKILSAPLILSFVIPLLYKYTPFGPFFRAKTKMIKNRWINPEKNESELLLLSTDNEDNISENGEYNIGYYSGTNL